MNILVTGGSGFIGTNLVSDLLKEGHKVLIYDKQRSETYPDLCMVADVRDKEKLSHSMREVDVVYHLAAEHRDDVSPVSLYYEVNVGGAENLVYAMEEKGVHRLIFTSTVALYGLNSGEPDEDSPIKPFNDYGKSKYQAEIVFNKWHERDPKRSLIIVRPTVIFGERNRGNVFNLLNQIASGKFMMVGDGKNKKSMGYVLNLTHFMTKLLESDPGIHIYNYSDKPDLDMAELVKITQDTLGIRRNNNIRIPYSIGLLGGYAFDILAKLTGRTFPISSIRIKKFCANTKITAEKLKTIGFAPPYSLSEGLKRMILSEFKKESDDRHP
jgi:nucleoside-diphosphate-sugar epimerase